MASSEDLLAENKALKERVALLEAELAQEKKRNQGLAEAVIKTEQEEESLALSLMNRLEKLKKEKEELALKVEVEEDFLANTLTRKLQKLRQEKVDLENELEQEEEFITNNFQKKISGLEAEKSQLASEVEALTASLHAAQADAASVADLKLQVGRLRTDNFTLSQKYNALRKRNQVLLKRNTVLEQEAENDSERLFNFSTRLPSLPSNECSLLFRTGLAAPSSDPCAVSVSPLPLPSLSLLSPRPRPVLGHQLEPTASSSAPPPAFPLWRARRCSSMPEGRDADTARLHTYLASTSIIPTNPPSLAGSLSSSPFAPKVLSPTGTIPVSPSRMSKIASSPAKKLFPPNLSSEVHQKPKGECAKKGWLKVQFEKEPWKNCMCHLTCDGLLSVYEPDTLVTYPVNLDRVQLIECLRSTDETSPCPFVCNLYGACNTLMLTFSAPSVDDVQAWVSLLVEFCPTACVARQK